MKKIFLMVAVMIAAISASFAQDFTFGARVGMNVANIGGDIDPKMDSKISLKAGVVACFPLADNIYLEPGLLFSPKGAKYEYKDIKGDNIKNVYNLNYLEIPISAVYKFEVNSNFAVRGHVGPYVGVGMFGRYKREVNGSAKEKDGGDKKKAFSSEKRACNYQRFDTGLNLGAGIEFSICYLGVQYGLGFMNFNSKNNKDYKMRNNVLSVDFGINF